MKKSMFVLILGLVLIGAFFTKAFADKQGCCRYGDMGKYKDSLDDKFFAKAGLILGNAEEIGLSEEQISRVKAVKLNAKKAIIKNDAEAQLAALEVNEALDKETIDINNVNTLIDKKYNIKSQKAKTLVSSSAEIKKILNKDQIKKVKDIYSRAMKDGKCMMDDKGMMDERKGAEHKKGMYKT